MTVKRSAKPNHKRLVVLIAGLAVGMLIMTCGQSRGRTPSIVTDSGSAEAVTRLLAPAPAFARANPAIGHSVTVADIAERALPGVVNISATKVVEQSRRSLRPFFNDPFFRDFFGSPFRGIPRERRQRSLGSGVIVSSDGIILTNNHVVEHAADVQVSLSDGREYEAKVVGSDPKSDIAVLRLEGDVDKLEPLAFGDSAALRLGEVVIAIGNPFGVGQTVTMGIVSATGRANVGIVDYEDFIQTDAAINPGNSGGALVNMRGELIGINTAILSRSGGYQGIGFAIPSNLARPIMKGLLEHGKVARGWLGVTIQDLDGEIASGLGLEVDRGVLVSGVTGDSPAAKAGFQRGDVIVAMAGRQMHSTAKLRNQIALAGPGAKVAFEVLRDGKRITLQATLGQLPAHDARGVVAPGGGALEGIAVADLTADTRRRYDIPSAVKQGVVVTRVEAGSRAQRAGLAPGDVILEFNRKAVKSAAGFHDAYKGARGTLLLLVQRQGSTVYIAIKK